MTALFANDQGDIEFTRGPAERHASLNAGISRDEILDAEITRAEARALAAALLAYADTPDPGPGAPYPMTEDFARFVDHSSLHPHDSIFVGFAQPQEAYGFWNGGLQKLLDGKYPA